MNSLIEKSAINVKMDRSGNDKQQKEKMAKSNESCIDTMAEPVSVMPEKWVNTATSETFYYVGVRGSPYATESSVFELSPDELLALTKRFQSSASTVVNGALIKGRPFSVINALAELGYRVICSTGEAEILWTLQREV